MIINIIGNGIIDTKEVAGYTIKISKFSENTESEWIGIEFTFKSSAKLFIPIDMIDNTREKSYSKFNKVLNLVAGCFNPKNTEEYRDISMEVIRSLIELTE